MKVCVLSESTADEEAIFVLLDGIRGAPVERTYSGRLRTRGWTGVFAAISTIVRKLHFHSDAEALVVVVDSDSKPIHRAAHDETGADTEGCRLCELREIVAHTQAGLRPVPGKQPLKVALGLAVPAIEAWYLCGVNTQVGEIPWVTGVQARKPPFTRKRLKELVYGTDIPSLELETARATEHARRLAQKLDVLRNSFPDGFGPLAREVAAW
jgi:hypothetical protein